MLISSIELKLEGCFQRFLVFHWCWYFFEKMRKRYKVDKMIKWGIVNER